jgi:hypothetical protein
MNLTGKPSFESLACHSADIAATGRGFELQNMTIALLPVGASSRLASRKDEALVLASIPCASTHMKHWPDIQYLIPLRHMVNEVQQN